VFLHDPHLINDNNGGITISYKATVQAACRRGGERRFGQEVVVEVVVADSVSVSLWTVVYGYEQKRWHCSMLMPRICVIV
jgi:hypothetical protein